MIYSNYTPSKPFDETIIRSVDSLVNSVFFDEKHISIQCDDQSIILKEYRKLIIGLPRRCGKTEYLKKLTFFFNKKRISSIIVVPKRTFITNHLVGLAISIEDIANYNPQQVMLYDEVLPQDIKVLGSKFTLGLYTR